MLAENGHWAADSSELDGSDTVGSPLLSLSLTQQQGK